VASLNKVTVGTSVGAAGSPWVRSIELSVGIQQWWPVIIHLLITCLDDLIIIQVGCQSLNTNVKI
jgi:hypothetical protein